MTGLKLAAALVCVLYGGWECIRRKQPLFFKLLLYAMASYLLGTCSQPAMHWSMAMNRRDFMWEYWVTWEPISSCCPPTMALSTGWRTAARPDTGDTGWLLPPVPSGAGAACHSVRPGDGLPDLCLLCLPIAPTCIFIKHLILPDVDLGIIRVMRPYNACVIVFCMVQVLLQAPACSGLDIRAAGSVLSSVLLMTLLPMAEMGVRKWFI